MKPADEPGEGNEMRKTPPFELVAVPLNEEAQALHPFRCAFGDVGRRHELGGEPDGPVRPESGLRADRAGGGCRSTGGSMAAVAQSATGGQPTSAHISSASLSLISFVQPVPDRGSRRSSVAQMHDTVLEAVFVQELQVGAYAFGKGSFAAAEGHGPHDQVALV